MWMCLATSNCFSSRTLPLPVEAHNTGSSEDRRRVMPAFPNNVPVVKALAGCTLLAGTRRWDCAGIPEAEGISRGSPSLRPAHHHPGPGQLDPNPGKELPRQDEMIIVIIVTRPKPAYGRQGLAGSWGQDTDKVSSFWVSLRSARN